MSVFLKKFISLNQLNGDLIIINKKLINKLKIDLKTVPKKIITINDLSIDKDKYVNQINKNINLISFIFSNEDDNFIDFIKIVKNILLENEINIGIYYQNDELLTKYNKEIFDYGIFVSKTSNSYYKKKEENLKRCKQKNIPLFQFDSNVTFCCKVANINTVELSNDESLFNLEENFIDKLYKYMDKSKKSNVEIYTKAGITKQVFSKIISNKNYNPKKETIICLIIGMELSLEEGIDLLNAAGFTLSKSLIEDVIIRNFLITKNYNLDDINDRLDKANIPPLGWKPRI